MIDDFLKALTIHPCPGIETAYLCIAINLSGNPPKRSTGIREVNIPEAYCLLQKLSGNSPGAPTTIDLPVNIC
jgi:hypothetical protein